MYQPSSNIEQSKVPIAVQNFLNKNTNIRDIVLHFDNDLAGRNATKAMIYALDKYNVYDIPAPYGKDINDYLCYSIGLKNRQEIDKYKIFEELLPQDLLMQKLDFLSEQALNLFTRKYRVSKFYSMGKPQSPFLNE